HVLLAQRPDHVAGGQVARRQLVRVEPDAHAVVLLAELEDVADALHAGQRVLDLDGGEITQIKLVVIGLAGGGVDVGVEVDDQEDDDRDDPGKDGAVDEEPRQHGHPLKGMTNSEERQRKPIEPRITRMKIDPLIDRGSVAEQISYPCYPCNPWLEWVSFVI